MKKRIYTVLSILSGVMLLTGCAGKMSSDDAVFTTTESDAANASAPDQSGSQTVSSDPENAGTATDEETAAYEPPTVTLRMVGDILLHTPVEQAALQEDGDYDFTAIFSHTKALIEEADLALVNQEVIIGGEELGISGYPAFNAPYDIADALADTGFDVICHATNHALDKGKKGILNTLANWKEKYPAIVPLGVYDNEEDSEDITVLDMNGISIAFLNYTYGTNGIALPSDMPYCVELLKNEQVIADLDQAEEMADFTVVCPHWGIEYALTPCADQENWCRLFLEHGADLVLGTHPHVIEPIEEFTDEAGHSMVVYYSLGNFVNWTSGTGEGVSNRMVGGMADVTLTKEEDGTVHISDYGVIPVVCHVTSGTNGVTVYPLSDYNEELGTQNEIRSQAGDFSYDYCVELTKKIWGEYCRK